MYKILVGTTDIVSIITSDDIGKDDNVLEQDYDCWEDAYLDATKLKMSIVESVYSLSLEPVYDLQ